MQRGNKPVCIVLTEHEVTALAVAASVDAQAAAREGRSLKLWDHCHGSAASGEGAILQALMEKRVTGVVFRSAPDGAEFAYVMKAPGDDRSDRELFLSALASRGLSDEDPFKPTLVEDCRFWLSNRMERAPPDEQWFENS